jgi:hypothetical protein
MAEELARVAKARAGEIAALEGIPEAARAMGTPEVPAARVPWVVVAAAKAAETTAEVREAAKAAGTPEVAAGAMAAVATVAATPVAAAVVKAAATLELLAVRAPRVVEAAVSVEARAPAKAAVLLVAAVSAEELAIPVAENPGERRLRHPPPPHRIRRAQQARGHHKQCRLQHV